MAKASKPEASFIGEHYNLVISIFGKRGSGKTFLCNKIAKEFPRIIVFDTRNRVGNHLDDPKIYDTILGGGVKAYDFDALAGLIEKNQNSYTYIFKPKNPLDDFEIFCEFIDCKEINQCLIWIEEVGLLTSANYSGIPEKFNHCLRFGRHHGLFLMMNAQRPVDVNRSITAESSHIISFQQTEPRDLQYFSGYFGREVERLPRLEKHHFLLWNQNGTLKEYDENQKEVSLDTDTPSEKPLS